jgi:hypothetical protein
MKCQWWDFDSFEETIEECNIEEDVRYLTCVQSGIIVCKKHACRCFPDVALSDEEIKRVIERKICLTGNS